MNEVGDIRKWLTFGLSAEQENRFRTINFSADLTQARIFVLLIIIPFVALLVNDYGFFGFSRTFYGLLVLRIAFAIYTILFLRSLRGFQDYRSYDRAEFFWAIFLALANTAINATRPENFVAHTIVTVLTVFIVVLAIPNRFTNQIILAVVYTIGQILVILPSLQTSPQASFTVLLSMFMANTIAIASSWLLHFWRRREFLVHEEIQKAKEGVEMQLTERKKAEEALRESETLLSAFLERLPVGVGLFDPHGRWLVSNTLLRNLMSDSIPSRDPESSWRWRTWGANGRLIPQSEWPGARALKGETVTPGLDFLYTSGNGQDIWMRVSSVPFRNDVEEITGIITVIQDIDKQKRAEESLKKSEKSLAEAQRIARLGNWELDIVTEELRWSDEIYRIFGLSPQEFRATYDAFLSYVHPDDREYVNNAVKEALNGKSYSIDHRIILANGEERIVHEQGEVIFDEKDTPVFMRGIIQDITEDKLAQQKIQESEERYRSFIENFKGIAFQADEKFIPVFLHGTVEEITGYSEEEFMTRQPWKEIIHPEDLPRIYEEEKKVRDSPHRISGKIDFRIMRRDGKTKWVHEIYHKIPGNNGKPDKYQGAIYDITERKEAEETLARIDILRQKEIHHRIKNNLQVISSLLDLAADKFNNRECIKDSEVLKAFKESQDRVISWLLFMKSSTKVKGSKP